MELKTISIETESYEHQKTHVWPKTGRHILASFDDKTIVVYQAFAPEIAKYAIEHGRFGGPKYSFTRMTWIKTNFLWMMYRSGWAKKERQETILALHLTIEGFEEILRAAREGKAAPGTSDHGKGPDEVRLQWDPDHSPSGDKVERRAIQLGLRGNILTRFHQEWLVRIEDVTSFVTEQRQYVDRETLERLVIPRERVFIPSDPELSRHIRLHGFVDDARGDVANDAGKAGTRDQSSDSSVGAACCADLLDSSHISSHGFDKDGFDAINATRTAHTVNKTSDSTEKGAYCSGLVEPKFSDRTQINGHICGKSTIKDNRHNNDVIICLGGAFNPVHTRHVQVMVETKKWLEQELRFNVVAGVLAVAPEGYVKAKCRKSHQRVIKAEHRIKMCDLACKGNDWLKASRKTTGSANQGGDLFKQENGIDANLVVIVGADRAINKSGKAKWHCEKGPITLCAGRVGETEKMKEAFEQDKRDGKVKKSDFFILPLELDNVSSTDIRDKLRAADDKDKDSKKAMVENMVELGWIAPEVADYLMQNEQDLYFN